jgi:hypothetical protein
VARKGFAASAGQRWHVSGEACANCGQGPGCDPAHLVPRSLGGCDDALCVIPLCRACHRAYDQGLLDIEAALEPKYRAELAHALQHVGLEGLRRKVSNRRAA